MYLMQVRSWAWAMYRRSWTAYQAGRLTRICPMPTTRLPPTARTHEDQHTSPCSPSLPPIHFSHFPLPLSFFPPLSPSTPSQRCGEKEGCWGRRRGEHSSRSPSSFTFSSKEKDSPSLHPTPFPTPRSPLPPPPFSLFPSWLLCWGRVFVTVTYKTVCYMKVNGYGGPMGVWRSGWEEVRGGLKKIDCKNESEGVLSIHFLWWYS